MAKKINVKEAKDSVQAFEDMRLQKATAKRAGPKEQDMWEAIGSALLAQQKMIAALAKEVSHLKLGAPVKPIRKPKADVAALFSAAQVTTYFSN